MTTNNIFFVRSYLSAVVAAAAAAAAAIAADEGACKIIARYTGMPSLPDDRALRQRVTGNGSEDWPLICTARQCV